MKGLLCYVYRWSLGDCTNKGITGGTPSVDSVVLIGAGLPELCEPAAYRPALYVNMRQGTDFPPIAVPEPPDAKGHTKTWWMHGGNFVYSSDSRFQQVLGVYGPIAVHDRREGN